VCVCVRMCVYLIRVCRVGVLVRSRRKIRSTNEQAKATNACVCVWMTIRSWSWLLCCVHLAIHIDRWSLPQHSHHHEHAEIIVPGASFVSLCVCVCIWGGAGLLDTITTRSISPSFSSIQTHTHTHSPTPTHFHTTTGTA
jgi:hypothetical protein